MKVMAEKGSDTSSTRLAQLERVLQQLARHEERERQQSVKSASLSTRHKLLGEQLQQIQEELAATQASKAKLYEEIGVLKQTQERQAKQLSKYKLDLQTARESHTVMKKKMETLEQSTSTTKQQYIRSLAARIQTSTLVLQQLKLSNGASFSARLAEKCNEWEKAQPNKRKRIVEARSEREQVYADDSKLEHEQHAQPREELSGAMFISVAATAPHDAVIAVTDKSAPSASNNNGACEKQEEELVQSKLAIEGLQTQVAKLESEYSTLNDTYQALVHDHGTILAENKASAQDIAAKEEKINELNEMLEILRSKQLDATATTAATKDANESDLEGRLKMLEDNLAQMNGYADQLEMVIAQCASCTIKLQSESTQDSVATRAE